MYCAQIKLALGCVQLVQIFELYTKLSYILKQKSLITLPSTIRRISYLAALAILLSLAILPIFSVLSTKIFNDINWLQLIEQDQYQKDELELARRIESIYGYVSGSEFLLLSVLFIIVFAKLTRMLSQSKYLSMELKSQQKDLKFFWLTVFFGYGIRTVVQFMYGHYYLIIHWYYARWMLYYISNPIMDVPNVLYVYWKHAVTFKDENKITGR